jgi:glycosyltransferase involved in cell wall biosynthesis
MGKKHKQKKKETKNTQPMVSICTPTFNRRPFIDNMINCYKNQTYPRSKMEWIIVDDGTDPIKDIIDQHTDLNIKYFHVEKMNLGKKRNFMHTKCNGSIIVYMDDDDYYPPERVSHSVERLLGNNTALCAGSSEIYVYFKDLNKMIQCGPYSQTHATAGTFAFKKRLLDITSYEDNAALAEERHFLKGYTIPFVQLDPMKTILVFSHSHNTFNKKEMLNYLETPNVNESIKTVNDFIKYEYEEPIKNFFLKDIDDLLNSYEPGLPKHKPDVLKQTEEIKKKREKMNEDAKSEYLNVDTGIQIQVNGKPKSLTRKEVMDIFTQQSNQIEELKKNNINVTLNQPNGEKKNLNLQELAEMAQTQMNTLSVQHQMIQKLKEHISELENKLEKEK